MSIVMVPPFGKIPKQVKLHSGETCRPDKGGTIRVSDRDDAVELIKKGWSPDAESAQALRFNDVMLEKGLAAQARHVGSAAADPARTVIGEVDALKYGRLHVELDHGAREIVVHGVHFADLGEGLRGAMTSAAAAFNEAEDAAEQVDARNLIGIVVASILDKDAHLAEQVRQRRHAARYGV